MSTVECVENPCLEYFSETAEANGAQRGVSKYNVDPQIHEELITEAVAPHPFASKVKYIYTPLNSGRVIGNRTSGFPLGGAKASRQTQEEYFNNDLSNDKKIPIQSKTEKWENRYKARRIYANMTISKEEELDYRFFPGYREELSRQFLDEVGLAIQIVLVTGTSMADVTDPANKGSDLLKGFPQLLLEHPDPEINTNYITQMESPKKGGYILIKDGQDVVTFDFHTFDELVLHMKHRVPKHLRLGLKCFVSDDIACNLAGLTYRESAKDPEKKKYIIESMKTYGGLEVEIVEGLSEGTVMVGDYNNLLVYMIEGSFTRSIGEDRDYDDWYFKNGFSMAPAIRDYRRYVVARNVVLAKSEDMVTNLPTS